MFTGIMLPKFETYEQFYLHILVYSSGLKQSFRPLDRHHVASKLATVYSIVVQITKQMLDGQHFALTSDHWTSNASTTFLAITCHFINEDWELVSLTLSCSEHAGRTTAKDCEREIKAALSKYELDLNNAVALVTDTENTMTLLGKLIEGDHHYCAAHVWELTTVTTTMTTILIDNNNGHLMECHEINSLISIRNKDLMDFRRPAKKHATWSEPFPIQTSCPKVFTRFNFRMRLSVRKNSSRMFAPGGGRRG